MPIIVTMIYDIDDIVRYSDYHYYYYYHCYCHIIIIIVIG